jgi:hypothetical protein
LQRKSPKRLAFSNFDPLVFASLYRVAPCVVNALVIAETTWVVGRPLRAWLAWSAPQEETDHLVESRFKLLLKFHDQVRMAEASGVDET